MMGYKAVIVILSLVMMAGHGSRSKYSNTSATVHLKKTGNGYALYRNGEPYFIKGAGSINGKYLRELKAAGANSIRIYSTDNALAILDSAHALGMTVFVGLNVAYAKKELDYKNDSAVARQKDRIRATILQLKDHPALLMWGVGNEPNLYINEKLSDLPDNIALAKAINNLAAMVHQLDHNHPTVLSVPGGSKNRLNKLLCDEIDLIAYNSFEPFDVQLERSSWSGPYIVTEFGAFGYWASPRTEWYSCIEQTSAEKRKFLRKQYSIFENDKANCLGSYAFLWGQKQEYTTTWFSLFTDDGLETELAAELNALWNKKSPAPDGMSIESASIENHADLENIYLAAGQQSNGSVALTGVASGPVSLKWEIERDTIEYLNASYRPSIKKVIAADTISVPPGTSKVHARFSFTTPRREGPYRIFFYLQNQQGRVSTANSCFYVHE